MLQGVPFIDFLQIYESLGKVFILWNKKIEFLDVSDFSTLESVKCIKKIIDGDQ